MLISVGTAAIVAAGLTALLLRPGDPAMPRFIPFASASQYEGSPAWSADGQTLAYVADVDGVLQVFVRRMGDALSRQITQSRFDAERPFWSPNGQLVYYISLAGDQASLWSIGVAGGRPELLFENVVTAAIDPKGQRLVLIRSDPTTLLRATMWWSSPPGSEPVKESRPPLDRVRTTDSRLAFSPDGQLLVWMNAVDESNQATLGSSFYLVPKNNGVPREILHGLTTAPMIPQFGWFPDNRHVVLSLPDSRLGNRHLWMADTESEELRQITATHTNETDPVVSRDGLRVAYASDEVDFDLVLVSPDGQSRRALLATARNEFSPVWAPSGDQFAFVTDRSGNLEIWVRSRDGQWERPVVTASDFGTSDTQALGSLAFSPDGRTLAYQRGAEGLYAIWLSPSTGGTPVSIGSSEGRYQDAPAWSPDGEWIAYSEAEREQVGARMLLKKVRVGTRETVVLATNLNLFSQIVWSPDGRWIACQTNDGAVRVPADGGKVEPIGGDALIGYAWEPDSRRMYALAEGETQGHFALVEIDTVTRQGRTLNPDLGSIPIANQPIRGFSYAKGQGFLTSLAGARSDIWLMEGFQQPRGLLSRLFRRGP